MPLASMLLVVVSHKFIIAIDNFAPLFLFRVCLNFLAERMRDIHINMIWEVRNGVCHYLKVWLAILLVLPNLGKAIVHIVQSREPLLRVFRRPPESAVPKFLGELGKILWTGWFILLDEYPPSFTDIFFQKHKGLCIFDFVKRSVLGGLDKKAISLQVSFLIPYCRFSQRLNLGFMVIPLILSWNDEASTWISKEITLHPFVKGNCQELFAPDWPLRSLPGESLELESVLGIRVVVRHGQLYQRVAL